VAIHQESVSDVKITILATSVTFDSLVTNDNLYPAVTTSKIATDASLSELRNSHESHIRHDKQVYYPEYNEPAGNSGPSGTMEEEGQNPLIDEVRPVFFP
jgi:hypothetical protein